MITRMHVKDQWYCLYKIYEKLVQIGFVKTPTNNIDDRIEEIEFSSGVCNLTITIDKLLGEIYVIWRNSSKRSIISEPLMLMVYLCDDIEALILSYKTSSDLVLRHQITMNIYEVNRWCLFERDMIEGADFLEALEKAKLWMLNEFRVLNPWEFERKLNSYCRTEIKRSIKLPRR